MQVNSNSRNEAKKYLKTKQLYENSSSKAKKFMKTKDMAISREPVLVRFVRQFTAL